MNGINPDTVDRNLIAQNNDDAGALQESEDKWLFKKTTLILKTYQNSKII